MLQLPLAFVLTNTFAVGPRGVFWAVTIGESAVAVLAVAIFLRGRWKLRVV